MCSACEDEDIEPRVLPTEEEIRRTRAIEAGMAGERVPERAWDIFFGRAGGSIEWPYYQRIRQAFSVMEESRPKSFGFRQPDGQRRRVPVCQAVPS